MQLSLFDRRGRQQEASGPLLGIDIGTSYARAALLEPTGRVVPVRDQYGATDFPSVVRFTMRGSDVGYYPERFLITDAENSVREVPRFLARYADLPPRVLAQATARVFEQQGRATFDVLYRTLSAEDVFARLIRYLADLASAQAGVAIRAAVVTVPANAEDRMRVSVAEAMASAGLRLLRIANQPTAALVALRRALAGRMRDGLVAVIDVGGGTTDVTIARVEGEAITIVATAGDPYLGGVELRRQVAEGINSRFRAATGADLLVHQAGHSRAGELALLRAAEEAIVELTRHDAAEVIIDHGAGFGRDLWTTITRSQVEQWIAPSLDRLRALCSRALRLAHVNSRELSAVALCGGGALNPAIRRAVASSFGIGEDALIVREPLGLAAQGAAILAGVEAGVVAGQVHDVTPYALGIAAFNAPYPAGRMVFCPVVRPGTPIPTGAGKRAGAPTELFYTRLPMQTELSLRVLQYRGGKFVPSFAAPADNGVEIAPEECEELGAWTLSNIRPRQQSEVDVTFSIDGNGILQLEAKERGSSNVLRQQIARW